MNSILEAIDVVKARLSTLKIKLSHYTRNETLMFQQIAESTDIESESAMREIEEMQGQWAALANQTRQDLRACAVLGADYDLELLSCMQLHESVFGDFDHLILPASVELERLRVKIESKERLRWVAFSSYETIARYCGKSQSAVGNWFTNSKPWVQVIDDQYFLDTFHHKIKEFLNQKKPAEK